VSEERRAHRAVAGEGSGARARLRGRRAWLQLGLKGVAGAGLAMAMAGCATGGAREGATTGTSGARPVTLRLQDWPGDFMDMVTGVAIPAFRAQQPHVTVEYTPYQGDWVPKTLAEMVGGTAPDVLHVFGSTTREFADRKQLLDLTPLVRRDVKPAEIADFHKAQWDAMVLPGSEIRYAIPKHLWMGFLIYDREAFEEAGVRLPDKQWGREAYETALTRLTRRAGGQAERWGGAIPATSYDRVYTHVLGDGGHMVDARDKSKPRFAEPAALGAFEWLRSRMWDQNVLIQRGQYGSEDNYTLLAQGRVAMIEEGTSFFYWLAEQMKRRWDIMHLPADSKQRVAHLSSNAYAVYAGVEQRGSKDASWALMRFLASPEYQRMMLQAKTRAIVPARKSVLPEYVKTMRQLDPRLDDVRLELVQEAIEMGYHHAVEPESFQNQPAALEVLQPDLNQIFQQGAPVSILQQTARMVEQTQPRS
jgi:ABC-type glycerol-3-phosphate transport system substrate-binding protein